MKRLTITAAVMATLMFPAIACSNDAMTKEEIAQLPRDKVGVIKQTCEHKWGDNFQMRIFCEDQQYKALKLLIERNS
jgi:hypothetical protein